MSWHWRKALRKLAGERWLARGLGLAVLGLAAGCGSGGGGPPADQAVAVGVARPEVTVVEDTLTAVGTIEAHERVTLNVEAPGVIESIGFREGERVQSGQKLFALDARKEAASVAQAEAEAALARSNLERARQLAGTRAISQQELEQLESQVAVKEATAKVEAERLADRVVTAPFEGVMGPRLVSPGQYVSPGTLLGTLVDDHLVKVRFRIPERQVGLVRVGQEGRLWVNAQPGRPFRGVVDLVNPEVEEATRTVEVRLRADNAEGLLRPGMFARGELLLSRREQAMVIPETALLASLDQFSVFTVQEGRARSQVVKVGVRLPGKAEIREGLGAESVVVVSGTQKIMDGSKVTTAAVAGSPGGPTATESGPNAGAPTDRLPGSGGATGATAGKAASSR